MSLKRGRLYPLLLLLIAGGYLWLLVNYNSSGGIRWLGCPSRLILHIPCPACGSTRAVLAIFNGEWREALYLNPLGFLLAAMMVVVPVWILADTVRGSDSLLKAYRFTEKKLQSRPYALTGIIVILIIWIWNLMKYT